MTPTTKSEIPLIIACMIWYISFGLLLLSITVFIAFFLVPLDLGMTPQGNFNLAFMLSLFPAAYLSAIIGVYFLLELASCYNAIPIRNKIIISLFFPILNRKCKSHYNLYYKHLAPGKSYKHYLKGKS
jgi:hypothetical protein